MHGYADDTQMYPLLQPERPYTSLPSACRSTERCLDKLSQRMVVSKLKCNPHKTEFIIFAPTHLRPLVDQPHSRDALVFPTSVVQSRGAYFDSGMTMLPHISRTVQGVYGAIKNISRIRRYLDDNTRAKVVQAPAISKLDYANHLLVVVGGRSVLCEGSESPRTPQPAL